MRQRHVAAIDQGVTSTRCMIFDASGRVLGAAQRKHQQFFPRPGWVEHDGTQIWVRVQDVVASALRTSGLRAADLCAVGVSNQRETTIVWDRSTGRPVHNALVGQDIRAEALCRELVARHGLQRFAARTGLPVASYFPGPKIRWLLDHVPGVRDRAERGELLFGTVDTWLIWNLTGGAVHVTDVTNASRTLLMDLRSLKWDEDALAAMGIPRSMLPEIRPSAEVYGTARGVLEGVPIAAALGDQQAALFGQSCLAAGEAKCTYSTGGFLLLNTGHQPVASQHGLLSTVGFQLEGEPAVYALEGAIADTAPLTRWLPNRPSHLGLTPELQGLAESVPDSGGVYLAPTPSRLSVPHWRPDAHGVLAGLTDLADSGHLARAVLETTAYQTREIVEAMTLDYGFQPEFLRVDGALTANGLLMQSLADVLDLRIVRSLLLETSCLGAAYAAGLATGIWPSADALRSRWQYAAAWTPHPDNDLGARKYRKYRKAVEMAQQWTVDDDVFRFGEAASQTGR
ncbi:glycerol kinase GlpK [Actinomadura opuntiae]|uniref:glycerol kinase GlpK n=1 Tax=Actinomadura sp. OS1-43 TaxID=604315 RepID=UPI00255B34DB|nr:glycerol kinase GlpK [Actinomadura sp. OS1-43]MDL4821112.1 glycerol kinase GlpK [Actinomadura sp. OS1-43]